MRTMEASHGNPRQAREFPRRLFGILGLAFAAFAFQLSACASLPRDGTVSDIPNIHQVQAKPVWRTYSAELLSCVGRQPVMTYDSIRWMYAPRGIPKVLFPTVSSPNRLIQALAFVKLHVIVLTPWLGDEERTIKDELTHVLFHVTDDADRRYFRHECHNGG